MAVATVRALLRRAGTTLGPRDTRLVTAGAALLLALATALQRPAPRFFDDAATYWHGAKALVGGGDVVVGGGLAMRGVLTSVLYAPAAAVTAAVGPSAAGLAVLVQNAVLIAVLGAVLLPRLVALWRPVTPAVIAVCAVGCWATTATFAPYPLTDLWAAALLLTAVVVVAGPRRRSLAVAGLAAGAALNLRPAHLVPVALVLGFVLLWRRAAGAWFALGIAVALLPQFLLGAAQGWGASPWPPGTAGVARLQAGYAAYVVRYDTLAARAGHSPLFFCSPEMAGALGPTPPASTGEFVGAVLHHLPQSAVLLAEKAAAALHWPVATPYFTSGPRLNGVFAVLVTLLTVVGAAALLRVTLAHRRNGLTPSRLVPLVAWLGSAATLLTSTTETRFALPLVLFGIAGCATLAPVPVPRRRGHWGWVVGALVVAAVVYAVGTAGLGHPVAGGAGTLADCTAS